MTIDMHSGSSLYMFAIMPPEDLAERIHAERLAFAQKYNATKALKPPVHITLYPPFRAEAAIENQTENLREWAAKQQGFTIELHNYSYFKNRRSPVVYIDVVDNIALNNFYQAFVQQLQHFMPAESSEVYKPHFTIGYRDVPTKRFAEIKDEYAKRSFTASFPVTSFFLWKHDGKKWNILKDFYLHKH